MTAREIDTGISALLGAPKRLKLLAFRGRGCSPLAALPWLLWSPNTGSMKRSGLSRLVFAALVTVLLIVLNLRLYYSPYSRAGELDTEGLAQLRFLDDAIAAGAADQMQRLFPEGFVFLHALHGLSWAELARAPAASSALRAEALQRARSALREIESEQGRAVFSQKLSPPYGIFYAGWSTWLRGVILHAAGPDVDPEEARLFTAQCDRIAAAFDQSATPFLQSYVGSAWPSDSLTAVAALRLHDYLLTPRYERTIAEWLQRLRSRLDAETGLIPHAAFSASKQESVRGSSQSLMLRFLMEIDPGLAGEHYRQYRTLFHTTWLGLPAKREYPVGIDGMGDVDSGPVVFGIGASATVVGLGTARAFNDDRLATALGQAMELVGFPFSMSERKRYIGGMLPIGDAFLVWSKLARPHVAAPPPGAHAPLIAWWWRLPTHAISLGIVFLLGLWLRLMRAI